MNSLLFHEFSADAYNHIRIKTHKMNNVRSREKLNIRSSSKSICDIKE